VHAGNLKAFAAIQLRRLRFLERLIQTPLLQYMFHKGTYMRKVYKTSVFLLFAAAVAAAPIAGAADLPDFTQLVEKNGPSVVNVTATQGDGDSTPADDADDQDSPDQGAPDQGMPDILRRFFGPGGPGAPGAPGGGRPRIGGESLGSGFIISADGYILTNNHVVTGAEKVVVRLSDRRELDAKVVGTDEKSDVALLKVNATGLPAVSIGDSSKLKPGQWVVAIGSPFAMDHSVTHGVVSYVGRSSRSEQYVPFIQTDVPINRGNSGGPLFNLDGQVVGINSQIYSNTGGYMGVSFSVPINLAMNTVEQLKTTGHVSRGMIGVAIQGMTRDAATSLGLPQVSGALVTQVTPGGGADKAGVQPRDVILAYNGQTVDQQSDLPLLVGGTKPGSTAQLKVFRDGKMLTLPVTVGELTPEKATLASLGVGGGEAKRTNPLGLAVEDITAEQRKVLGLKDQNGVVISKVGGAAQRTGLQAGDIVLMVGRQAVKSAGEFHNAVKDVHAGDSVMLLVKRNEATQFVTIAVPKPKNG
jgi:serine protease Do